MLKFMFAACILLFSQTTHVSATQIEDEAECIAIYRKTAKSANIGGNKKILCEGTCSSADIRTVSWNPNNL